METSDRKIILQEITEVEQRIARLQKQQEEAETILRSLKEPDQANRRLRQIGVLLKFRVE